MVIPRRDRKIGSGGSSTVGVISFDKEAIKLAFRSQTAGRKFDSRYKNDAGYFSGGRCEWGAGHSFDEDVQKLVGTFNKVAEMSGAIASLKECSNSEEFLSHKNALLAKCNQAINEMNLTTIENEVGGYSGLCIIWEDYTATFLSPYITAFTSDLRNQMDEINELNYEELVQLEALKLEEGKIKGEIEDAYRRYNETDDPSEQEEILIAVRKLKQKHDEVIDKINANSWNKTGVYDYTQSITQLISLMEGKISPDTSVPPNTTPPGDSGSNQTPTGSNGGNKSKVPTSAPWKGSSESQNNQQNIQIIILVGVGLLILFFFINQKNKTEPNYYDY